MLHDKYLRKCCHNGILGLSVARYVAEMPVAELGSAVAVAAVVDNHITVVAQAIGMLVFVFADRLSTL